MRSSKFTAAGLVLAFFSTPSFAQTVEEAEDGTIRIKIDNPAVPAAPVPVPQVAKVFAPAVSPAPDIKDSVVNGGSPGDLTIAITNSYGAPLSLAFDNNAGAPAFVGNPQPTSLPVAAETSYAVPSGWAGRVVVGKINHSDNSKIEGSFYGAGNGDIDVSYVDGYSVPISCSVGDVVVTGCNMELFDQECTAPDSVGEMGPDGKPAVCSNGSRSKDWGPASQFFSSCAGAAYTFPKDDTANTGMISELQISCCVGTSCPASPHQKSQKRNVQSPRANAPSLLPRSHKLREQLHGRSVHGHKYHI
ncbi:MAG: hypothetical protein Q9220_005088 [cf. Caloplaca sp. 1 TL-2023]